MQRVAGQWMTSPAIVVPETTTLPAARALMRTKRVRRLPVVDARGRLVGIVTQGDINRISDSHVFDVRSYNMYRTVAELPLRDMMTRDVVVVTPDTPVVEVAQLLLDRRIGGVPVVDDGAVVGVITESDLFRLLIAEIGRAS